MINRKQGVSGTPGMAISRENILLFNAVLCFMYAICYVVLVGLSFSEETTRSELYTVSVITLNVIFLSVLLLTLNTILVVYSHIAKPRKPYIQVACGVALVVWLLYMMVAYYSAIFVSGFLTHYHQYIRFSFRTFSWPVGAIAFSFAVGFSLLFAEYYRQVRMKHVLYFIIPAIFQFSFKVMCPFLFFIAGWIFFGGCQLLLYYSIMDSRQISGVVDKKLAMAR